MDPTLKNRTISALKRELPELSPRLKAAVAKYIVDHPSGLRSGPDPRDRAQVWGVDLYAGAHVRTHGVFQL